MSAPRFAARSFTMTRTCDRRQLMQIGVPAGVLAALGFGGASPNASAFKSFSGCKKRCQRYSGACQHDCMQCCKKVVKGNQHRCDFGCGTIHQKKR